MTSLTRLNRGSLDKINQTLLPIDKTGLVGYWPFWENIGTTAYDESKTGNDGTINGATWTWLADFAKPGLSFDGTDDSVDFGTIGLTEPVTILFWFKTSTVTGSQDWLIASFDSAETYDEDFEWGTSGGFWTADTQHFTWDQTDGAWHHGVILLNGASSHIYVDATDKGTFSSTYADVSDGTLKVGTKQGTEFYPGDFHGLMYYGRVLTAGEITAIYEKTKP